MSRLLPFEDFVLNIANNPDERIFFCKLSTFKLLDPCVQIHILYENSNYVMFKSEIPQVDLGFNRTKSCKYQTCKYCKGFGVVVPNKVYTTIVSLSLSPSRQKLEDWEDIYENDWLFKLLVDLYSMDNCKDTICKLCILNNKCKMKLARRWCIPVTEEEFKNKVKSPSFAPVAKAGLYPMMFLDPFEVDDFMLCNFTTIRVQGNGIVQQGMRDRPRFYLAKYKKSLAVIDILKISWDMCYQYAISRRLKMSIHIKPFIVTPRINEQIHFGGGFTLVNDNTDFIWRTRPFITYPFIGEYEIVNQNIEVLPWNLNIFKIFNDQSPIKTRIQLGLMRVFGHGCLNRSRSHFYLINNKAEIISRNIKLCY